MTGLSSSSAQRHSCRHPRLGNGEIDRELRLAGVVVREGDVDAGVFVGGAGIRVEAEEDVLTGPAAGILSV